MLSANDPSLSSFIAVDPQSDFPIQNLPFSVFSTQQVSPRVCSALGDFVLDLAALAQLGYFAGVVENPEALFLQSSLNKFMAAGASVWQAVRDQLSQILRHDNPTLRDNQTHRQKVFYPMTSVTLHLPIEVGDYTDFYSSINHARNTGKLFRDKDNPLLPNYVHLPVGYHGRASSIVPSGTKIKRPQGQILLHHAEQPIFAATKRLDFELEMAFVIGQGNALGEPIAIETAYQHIFGMTLLNDWSARDIQKWEYIPLGPFLSKSFATSISPWIVTLMALQPFKVKPLPQSPQPLTYLQFAQDYTLDIQLSVTLQTQAMTTAFCIARTNFNTQYWTMAQQLAHHTVNGCNTRVGDLMASGTISGTEPGSYGSLLELTNNGATPLHLPENQTRTFLEDGDILSLHGYCQGQGYRVGFGTVTGQICE